MSSISETFNFNFYPRPLRGGRRTSRLSMSASRPFLSTPSARRATFFVFVLEFSEIRFLSTPSARRATFLPYIYIV